MGRWIPAGVFRGTFNHRCLGSRVAIDPRMGTTYAEVLTLLDDVLGAGATDIVFKGTFER